MPKSAILMLFFSSSNRFSGFRSLWLEKQWDKRENETTPSFLGHTVETGDKGDGVVRERPPPPPPYRARPCPVTRTSPAGGWRDSPLLCPRLLLFPSPCSHSLICHPAEKRPTKVSEEVFISCHPFTTEPARGNIQQIESLLQGPSRWRAF